MDASIPSNIENSNHHGIIEGHPIHDSLMNVHEFLRKQELSIQNNLDNFDNLLDCKLVCNDSTHSKNVDDEQLEDNNMIDHNDDDNVEYGYINNKVSQHTINNNNINVSEQTIESTTHSKKTAPTNTLIDFTSFKTCITNLGCPNCISNSTTTEAHEHYQTLEVKTLTIGFATNVVITCTMCRSTVGNIQSSNQQENYQSTSKYT